MAHAQTSHTPQTFNLAQTLPPPPRTGPFPLLEPQNSRQLPPPNDLLQQPMAPSPPTKETTPSVTDTITVKQFRFIGNTAFTARQLARLVARFTNRPITFAELLSARTAITNFYLQHGFINCGALIPANQVFREGIITIQVVEGRVEAIEVTGTKRLSPNYVRARLRRATSQPLNRDRLLEALQLLKLNPLIKNISATLSVGSQPGASVLVVEVTEARTLNAQIILNNNRPPSIGTFERGLQLTEADLLGLGDSLSAGYTNTDGSHNVNASYTLPLNARNSTLSLNYGNTWSHVVEPPFNQLNINANFRYYDITLRQPVVQTPRKEIALGLTASRRESDTSFLGSRSLGYIISPGANQKGQTRISALRFFQEYTRRNSREVIAVRSQFSLGIGALDATLHNSAPDNRFFAWLGQGQFVHLLAPDTLLLFRTDIQLSSRTLVPLEQFGLGGEETVRGYRQDFLLTDNAFLASIEIRLPIYRVPTRQTLLQLAPFFDVGTGWNNSANTGFGSNTNTLASIGLGLQLQLGNNFSARLDYGIPLVDVSFRKRTWQENGFSFQLQLAPF